MKVLYIGPGNDIHLARWINRCTLNGVDTYFYNSVPNLETQRINAKHLNKTKPPIGASRFNQFSLIRLLKSYVQIRKIIHDVKPDVIHLQWFLDLPQFASTFLKNVKIVSTPFGSDILKFANNNKSQRIKYLIAKVINKRIVSKSKMFCCDAQHMANELVNLGAESKTIKIIYFGTDVEIFSPKARQNSFFEKFGVPKDNLVVLSNRGLAPVYDIETLIESVSDFQQKISVAIVGGGPSENYLKTKAAESEARNNIYFLGRLNDQDFVCATASCDIYVSTSTSDGGLAASVAEAMACQIPVVITDFGDNAKWLQNETAGKVFPIGNSKKLSEIINSLASNPSVRTQMGKTGRKIICADNNSKLEMNKILEMYESILGNN